MSFKDKITQSETLKKIANKKIILGVSAIIVACTFIGITSFIPFIITGEKLGSEKFWTDELIIIAITIFAMISALFIGQAGNAQDSKSKLAKSKVKFMESAAQITNINAFCQWVKKVLQPQDIRSMKERELRKHGIDDYSVLELSDAEIKALANDAQKYNGRYYSQISQEQADFILKLKDGVKKIKLVEPEYYLSVSSIENDKTDSEKSGRESTKKNITLTFSIVSKILIALIPAMIFAALARDLSGEGVDQAEAWATFCSRMISMISSAFMGYLVGCQMNDIDADYIFLRTRVHQKFLQDKTFVPLTQQQQAREDFINRVKRDNEKYSESLGLGKTAMIDMKDK